MSWRHMTDAQALDVQRWIASEWERIMAEANERDRLTYEGIPLVYGEMEDPRAPRRPSAPLRAAREVSATLRWLTHAP